MRRRTPGIAGFATCVLVSSSASAQVLNRFEPSERGSRFLVADSLELDGKVRFATGLVVSYGSSLRTFEQRGADREASTLISSSTYLHPGASVVLAPGMRVALDIPLAFQSGTGATLAGAFQPEPASPRPGDMRLAMDLRLAGRASSASDGASLAAGVVGYLPTGSNAAYSGDDFVRFGVRVSSSFTRGWFLGAARVGYMYRKDDVPPLAGVEIGSELTYVIALGATYKGFVVGPELYGHSRLNDLFKRRSTPTEIVLGVKAPLGDFRFGVGAGAAVVTGLGAPGFRMAFSIEWTPPPASLGADRDRDGVNDDDDICPDVPGTADAPPEIRGCPIGPATPSPIPDPLLPGEPPPPSDLPPPDPPAPPPASPVEPPAEPSSS